MNDHPPHVERWLRTAPPWKAARVRVLGVLFALNRLIEQCEREAARVRERALRSRDLDARRPCDPCGATGWVGVAEESEDGGLWCRSATRRDCGACRARRLFLSAEIAGAKYRADELDALAAALTALSLEILPEVEKALARARVVEWQADRAKEIEEAREVMRNLSRST